MKALLAAVPLAFLLSIAACGGSDPVVDEANNTEGLDEIVEAANVDAEAVNRSANGSDADDDPSPADLSATIPAGYRGRWGMVPADCISTRGDAKGLITIGDMTVRFYESVATLKERRPSTDVSFSGLFAFTGEGQSWEKVMTFTRTGDTLLRAEEDGRFTYRRC